jgi:hypothetical protein
MYRGTYTLIGSELSMFTRKLEAQLRYQKIPHVWKYKGIGDGGELEKPLALASSHCSRLRTAGS